MTDNNEIIHIGGGDNMPQQKKVPSSLQDFIDLFLSEHNVRKSSTDRYRKSLKVFSEWITRNKVAPIEKADLKRYNDWLHDEKSGFSNLTIMAYITAVRIFYTWLYDEDYIAKNIAKNIANPETSKTHQRKALSEEQCKELLNFYKSKGRIRDFAMVNLMLRIGLRTIEVSRLKIEDIGTNQGKRAIWIQGKGRTGKEDYNLLEDPAYLPLEEYIKSRGEVEKTDYLFVSQSRNGKGNQLETKTISSTVREGLNAIGLTGEEYTAHSLRNTCGSLMIKNGVPLPRVQQVLRHKNIATTQGYVHDAEEAARLDDSPESSLNNSF